MKHITFATDNMTISAANCSESALKYGCDEYYIYTPHDYSSQFYEENKSILDQPRGAGYWLWKPWIIQNELCNTKENDLLIYTDAGITFENHVSLMVEEMNNDIMVFGNRWRHGDWCKMDVLVGMDCVKFSDRDQLQASCVIV